MKMLIALAATAAAAPTTKPVPAPAPSEIVAAAPASDWVTIAAANLLVMDLAPLNDKPRRVVIQLMPAPFSERWVGNIRKLAAAHWWDRTSINRVQDNYVVQWGDANAEDKAKAKALPGGLARVPQSEYLTPSRALIRLRRSANVLMNTGYGGTAMFDSGWPIAKGPSIDNFDLFPKNANMIPAWPVHCYGMVGVGRDMPPDTGTGAELYTVIGHAPRHLDRNIALVGRVIAGIEHLSSLPRGTGPLGFYEKAEERTPIVAVRMGNEVTGLPTYQYLSTESASFATYADARANRRDPFFIQPAGGADICNVPVPIRKAP